MTNNLPLVSCVIPTKKGMDTIMIALNSVVMQTYKNIQVIIFVNDSDPVYGNYVKNLATNFPNSNLKIIFSEANLNVVESFNAAMSFADGDYAFWLSDDDRIDSTYVEKLLNNLHVNKTSVVAFCNFVNVDITNGREISRYKSISFNDSSSLVRYIKACVKTNAMAIYGLYRINFLRRNPLKFIDFFDVDLVLKAVTDGGLVAEDEILIYIGSKGVRTPYSIISSDFDHHGILKSQWSYLNVRYAVSVSLLCCCALTAGLIYSYFKRRRYGVGVDPRL